GVPGTVHGAVPGRGGRPAEGRRGQGRRRCRMNCKKMDGLNEDELIGRATAAWLRRCRRTGRIEDQPSAGLSECRDGTIRLRNVNGVLATYAVANGRLRLLEDAAHAAN